MKYQEIIKEECIDDYQRCHCTIYRDLLSLQFAFVFLESCERTAKNYPIYETIWFINTLSHHEWERIILVFWKLYLDQGKDIDSLAKFIKLVQFKYCKDEYVEYVKRIVMEAGWRDSKIMPSETENALRKMRNHVIAHNLKQEIEECELHLKSMRDLYNRTVSIFKALSFDPDFCQYAQFTFDESELINMADNFFRYQLLSAHEIISLSCEIGQQSTEASTLEIRHNIQRINSEITERKNDYRHSGSYVLQEWPETKDE